MLSNLIDVSPLPFFCSSFPNAFIPSSVTTSSSASSEDVELSFISLSYLSISSTVTLPLYHWYETLSIGDEYVASIERISSLAFNTILGPWFKLEASRLLVTLLFSYIEYPAFPIKHNANKINKKAYTFIILAVSPGFLCTFAFLGPLWSKIWFNFILPFLIYRILILNINHLN